MLHWFTFYSTCLSSKVVCQIFVVPVQNLKLCVCFNYFWLIYIYVYPKVLGSVWVCTISYFYTSWISSVCVMLTVSKQTWFTLFWFPLRLWSPSILLLGGPCPLAPSQSLSLCKFRMYRFYRWSSTRNRCLVGNGIDVAYFVLSETNTESETENFIGRKQNRVRKALISRNGFGNEIEIGKEIGILRSLKNIINSVAIDISNKWVKWKIKLIYSSITII